MTPNNTSNNATEASEPLKTPERMTPVEGQHAPLDERLATFRQQRDALIAQGETRLGQLRRDQSELEQMLREIEEEAARLSSFLAELRGHGRGQGRSAPLPSPAKGREVLAGRIFKFLQDRPDEWFRPVEVRARLGIHEQTSIAFSKLVKAGVIEVQGRRRGARYRVRRAAPDPVNAGPGGD